MTSENRRSFVVGKRHVLRDGTITTGVLDHRAPCDGYVYYVDGMTFSAKGLRHIGQIHETDLMWPVEGNDIDPLTGVPRQRGPFSIPKPVFQIGTLVVCDRVHPDTDTIEWGDSAQHIGLVGVVCDVDEDGDCWIYFSRNGERISPYDSTWLRRATADEIAKAHK